MKHRAEPLWEWGGPGPVRVQLTPRVRALLHSHVNAEANREIGGFLIGRAWPESAGWLVVVEDLMPVEDARATQNEFTFRAEAWIQLHHKGWHASDAAARGPTCVGWYHTHPGHGVFFSGPDQETHRAKFPSPWQVGLVIDPSTCQAGFFYWHSERRLGPVDLHKVPGVFDWSTGDFLKGRPASPHAPPDVERWAIGAGLLGLGAGLAAALAIAFSLPAAQARDGHPVHVLPYRADVRAFQVELPPGRWQYKLAAAEDAVPLTFTRERTVERRGPKSLDVPYADVLGAHIQGPPRLWLREKVSGARPFAVDLPEIVGALPRREGLVSIPLAAAGAGQGRYYLRDAAGDQGGDRVVELVEGAPTSREREEAHGAWR